ncbi:hypothetical protein LIER_23801 [Lithospermum erythrorhizon]|uniref:Uncharacterized protein n=1 Tax=Lithospermum erythrorhizon TaxID=34254 RepID=A0AAV3R2Y1_LITER
MHAPMTDHLLALKRIIRYQQGMLDYGLHLYKSSSSSLATISFPGPRSVRPLFLVQAEAEYRGVANVVLEASWLQNLLLELHNPLTTATIVYCDNIGAIYLSENRVQHQRTKHVELDIRVLHVPFRYQIADIFTKGLPQILFTDFRDNLSVRLPPATTAGVY